MIISNKNIIEFTPESSVTVHGPFWCYFFFHLFIYKCLSVTEYTTADLNSPYCWSIDYPFLMHCGIEEGQKL